MNIDGSTVEIDGERHTVDYTVSPQERAYRLALWLGVVSNDRDRCLDELEAAGFLERLRKT